MTLPALLQQISPQIIGNNRQELVNQIALSTKPKVKIPFTFAMADATILLTIPALVNGASGVFVERLYWEITTPFTGGSSSAIGVSSTNSLWNTKGDFLGGATGDVAATLVATGALYKGTSGTKVTSTSLAYLLPGDSLRYDKITSAFTSGSGFIHMHCSWID